MVYPALGRATRRERAALQPSQPVPSRNTPNIQLADPPMVIQHSEQSSPLQAASDCWSGMCHTATASPWLSTIWRVEGDKPLEKALFPWSSVLTTTPCQWGQGLTGQGRAPWKHAEMSTPEVKDILVLVVPGLDTCWPSTEPQPHVLDNTEVTALELEIAVKSPQ